ncbi:hypothetical protein HRO20_003500 [Vibrio cholerae]|nr:hypothetical protein [Vibrio cholerae]EJL6692053.1 hypothetical protein [Vibrio cholerae]
MKILNKETFFIILSISTGAYIGFKFGQNERLKLYKLLNLTGLIYDFFAVILLSYVILISKSIQDKIANIMTSAYVIFTFSFPFSFLLSYSENGGDKDLGINLYMLFIHFIPAIYVLFSPVSGRVYNVDYPPEKRIKILGSIILIVGFAFQIIASYLDLNS